MGICVILGFFRSFDGSDWGPRGRGCLIEPPGTCMRLDDTEIWAMEQILGHHDTILTTFERGRGNGSFWVLL